MDEFYPFIIACLGFYAWIPQEDIMQRIKVYIIFPLAKSDINKLCEDNKFISE
jgi:hypothetical protein